MVNYSYPYMFYLFVPFIFIIILILYNDYRLKIQFDKLGIYSIKEFLLSRVNKNNINLKIILFCTAITFTIIAATGPQIGTKLKELNREGIDIYILLDTSISMNAEDVKPSRMDKAKYELNKLINHLEGDRVGLIAFAGTAHLHCPITEDYTAARLFLDMMDTKLIASQGTDVSKAMRLAFNHIENDADKYKVILLVSDGEDHQGNALELANLAYENDITIHTLGVGTISGGPIPILNNATNKKEYKRKNGKVITSILNEQILYDIAMRTGGIFVRIDNQANAINPLIEKLNKMDKKQIKSHIYTEYEDRYQIFLFISLLLFIFEFILPTQIKEEITWESRFIKKNN